MIRRIGFLAIFLSLSLLGISYARCENSGVHSDTLIKVHKHGTWGLSGYDLTVSQLGDVTFQSNGKRTVNPQSGKIPQPRIEPLIKSVDAHDFFTMKEPKGICEDAASITVFVRANGKEREINDSCGNRLGSLAAEIERVTGITLRRAQNKTGEYIYNGR